MSDHPGGTVPTEEDEKKHMPKDDIPGGTPVPAADLPVHK